MVFAASVTSSPNGSPGFGAGAWAGGGAGAGAGCAKPSCDAAIKLVTIRTNAARRATDIELSHIRLPPTPGIVGGTRSIARRRTPCLPGFGGRHAHHDWRGAALSPYNPGRKEHPM